MIERLQRSWTAVMQCLAILRQDRSLLLFPLFSVISILLITATFAFPLLSSFRPAPGNVRPPDHVMAFIWLFLFYFVQFSVMNFFNTALVEVALRRFDGEQATIQDGLRRAWARLPVILAYSVVAATVGCLLRTIGERIGVVGRVVVGLLGFAWTIGTALVVPVLAAEDVGPIEALFRSAELVRNTWGEQLIGRVGISVAFALVFVVSIVGGVFAIKGSFALSFTFGLIVLTAVVIAISILILAQITLQGIYAAALYRFAAGDSTTGIDQGLLEGAFRTRG
jgi:hypothetical protein